MGRTNCGMIRLTKDREAKTSLKCFKEMSNEYKRLSKDDIEVVRVLFLLSSKNSNLTHSELNACYLLRILN